MKGQSVSEYAFGVAIIVLALFAMTTYAKRGLQARYYDMARATNSSLKLGGNSSWYEPNATNTLTAVNDNVYQLSISGTGSDRSIDEKAVYNITRNDSLPGPDAEAWTGRAGAAAPGGGGGGIYIRGTVGGPTDIVSAANIIPDANGQEYLVLTFRDPSIPDFRSPVPTHTTTLSDVGLYVNGSGKALATYTFTNAQGEQGVQAVDLGVIGK
jgi:hypothetical protein